MHFQNSGWASCRSALLVLLVSLALCPGCSGQEKPRFVEGPEATDLAQRLTGYLLINQNWDSADPNTPRILALRFPDLQRTVVRRRTKYASIWLVSGPDQEGHVAFVERDMGGPNARKASRHTLKTICIGGTGEELIFERPGDTIYDGVIGEDIALSPVGGLVAFVSSLENRQLPGALFQVGRLEIWDLSTKTGRDTGIEATSRALSWFPNGEELAYVALARRDELPNGASLPASPYGNPKPGGRAIQDLYPAVYVLNIKTGEKRLLHPGMDCVLAIDGKAALIFNGGQWVMVDIDRGDTRPFNYPESWAAPSILLSPTMAMFRGFPTVGFEPRWLQRGSFMVGTQMGAGKVGDISTWGFQTVLPAIDPRDDWSFGIVKEPVSCQGK